MRRYVCRSEWPPLTVYNCQEIWYFLFSVISFFSHPSNEARCMIFGWTLRLLPYFMCANSDGSGETSGMRRLAWAFAGRQCDKYHNLMSWQLFLHIRCWAVMFQVVVTNTVPHDIQKMQCHKIKTVDISGMLVEAIRRIHNNESMSYLFRHIGTDDWSCVLFCSWTLKLCVTERQIRMAFDDN